MPKFEKQFVHFMWDSELVGKECFVADDIDSLIHAFNAGAMCMHEVIDSHDGCYPFALREGGHYRFAYYDPNYECKKACEEGRKIQISGDGETWVDWEDDGVGIPDWNGIFLFRVKSEETKSRRMCYRELAEWLAKGNGQVSYNDGSIATEVCVESGSSYFESKDKAEVPVGYRIRRWGSDVWIEPAVDIYTEDCKK